jgi:hypothetical protein
MTSQAQQQAAHRLRRAEAALWFRDHGGWEVR